MARILYFPTTLKDPTGGIQVMYRHVETLAAHGFPAFICENRPVPLPHWLPFKVQRLFASEGQLRIAADDIFVIPEVYLVARELEHAPVRKILLCQNHFLMFHGIGDRRWQEAGVHEALCVSPVIADHLREFGGFRDPQVVPCPIEAAPYALGPRAPGIAYMPRKRADEIPLIRRAFLAAHPQFADVPWAPIANRSPAEVAAILRRCSVFLSLSHREGFGLPPLEAMAAGCVVAGYHGHGGLDYAPENGFWSADQDNAFDTAHQLAKAVQLAMAGGPELDHYRERTTATVARYSPHRYTEALLNFWRGALSGTKAP